MSAKNAETVKLKIDALNAAKTARLPFDREIAEWIGGLPYAGEKIRDFWQQLQANPTATLAPHEAKIRNTLQSLISGGAGIIGAALEFIVGIIISALLLAKA